jgi:hypothetical protein
MNNGSAISCTRSKSARLWNVVVSSWPAAANAAQTSRAVGKASSAHHDSMAPTARVMDRKPRA